MCLVEAKNICKKFKNEAVLENVNFTLEAGEICAIIGRNGSGKSVFLKMAAGLLVPDSGEIRINGEKLRAGHYAKDIGVLLDCTGFIPGFTAMENLMSIAAIRKVISKADIAEVIARVGLDPDSKKTYRKFSLGMKQKLAIAQAIMERPRLLLLDEPMNSLDEDSVEDMRGLILDYVKKNNAGVILTSHNREDIQAMCGSVYEIKKKTFVKAGEKDEEAE